jgi:hypothetical protein
MRIPSLLVLICFLVNTVAGSLPAAKAEEFILPPPGLMVRLSPEFNPPVLKGIKVHRGNPFLLDFILDQGDSPVLKQDEASKLIKYFLAGVTIPEKDLWVNLSPYEKDRIIPDTFALTEMGRDLLGEDYMLKQVTASLIYPEDELGRKFWKRIYQEAAVKFGTTDIPVNTFNKVWIVPQKAVIYENAKAGTAYVVESRLKVMLEQDYLSLEKHGAVSAMPRSVRRDAASVGANIIREIIIPELTKEVNSGKNFSILRQVYNSLILAAWYKKKIKDSILAQVYADRNKVEGVNGVAPFEKEKIYRYYLQAFRKGVYNYVKEEQDPITRGWVPRKYFSGGVAVSGYLEEATSTVSDDKNLPGRTGRAKDITVNLVPEYGPAADSAQASPPFYVSAKDIFARLGGSTMQVNQIQFKITYERIVSKDTAANIFLLRDQMGHVMGEIFLLPVELQGGERGLAVISADMVIEGQGLLTGFLDALIRRFNEQRITLDFIDFKSIWNKQTYADILDQIRAVRSYIPENDRLLIADIDKFSRRLKKKGDVLSLAYQARIRSLVYDYHRNAKRWENIPQLKHLNDLIKPTPFVRIGRKLGFSRAEASFTDGSLFNIRCWKPEGVDSAMASRSRDVAKMRSIFHEMDGADIHGKDRLYRAIHASVFLQRIPATKGYFFLMDRMARIGEIQFDAVVNRAGKRGLEISWAYLEERYQQQGVVGGFLEGLIKELARQGIKIDFLAFAPVVNKETFLNILEQIKSEQSFLPERYKGLKPRVSRYIKKLKQQGEGIDIRRLSDLVYEYDSYRSRWRNIPQLKTVDEMIKTTPFVRLARKLGFGRSEVYYTDKILNIRSWIGNDTAQPSAEESFIANFLNASLRQKDKAFDVKVTDNLMGDSIQVIYKDGRTNDELFRLYAGTEGRSLNEFNYMVTLEGQKLRMRSEEIFEKLLLAVDGLSFQKTGQHINVFEVPLVPVLREGSRSGYDFFRDFFKPYGIAVQRHKFNTGDGVRVILTDEFWQKLADKHAVDRAMTNKGGIDFSADKFNVQVQNQGPAIRFDLGPAMLKRLQNAAGFAPVIINIRPVPDLRMFLGVNVSVSPDGAVGRYGH